MFDDINEVRLMGNITNDPELRFTPNGAPVLSFGMATNRRYKKGEEWTDEVTFHNVIVWSNLAQNLSPRIKKGTKVLVSGRIQVRNWEGTDGKKNYKTEVVADNVILLDRYNKGTNAELGGVPTAPTAGAAPKGKKGATEAAPSEEVIDPDDLPF